MRPATCLFGLLLLGWSVGLGEAARAGAAGAPEGAAPAAEIIIPGVSEAEPIQSVAMSSAQDGRSGREAIFLCRNPSHPAHDRLCHVVLFGDEPSAVAQGSPLFPGMFCSIDASMAWSAGGKLAIATSCRRDGEAGVWLHVTDRNGDPLGSPSLVATVDPVGPVTDPLIVPRDDGAFWVFWLGGCPEHCRLTGRRYGWNGAPLGDATAFTPPGGAAYLTRLAGAALPGGGVIVAWENEGDGDGGRRITLLRLDGGGKVVARRRLSGGDPSASDRMPVVEPTAGGCVVAWQRTRPRSSVPPTVLVQQLNKGLSPAGPPLDLHDLRPEAFAVSSPAIAPRGRDLLVAWRETSGRAAVADLVVGRLSSDGSWVGEPRRVARSLPNESPRIWLEPVARDEWDLFWRQPPEDAKLPHPWLRRVIVPWQGPFWQAPE